MKRLLLAVWQYIIKILSASIQIYERADLCNDLFFTGPYIHKKGLFITLRAYFGWLVAQAFNLTYMFSEKTEPEKVLKSLGQHETDLKRLIEQIHHQLAENEKKGEKKLLVINRGGTASNTTRDNSYKEKNYACDLTKFNQVIRVDVEKGEMELEPGVTMAEMVQMSLQYGVVPQVVPEFPGITVGGAIQGAALESTSFRYGQFNDTCVSLEIVLGNGDCVVATKDNEYSDLFRAVSGTYGSVGIITKVILKVVHAPKYVLVRYYIFESMEEWLKGMKTLKDDETTHFIEGIVLGRCRYVLIVGTERESIDNNVEIRSFTKGGDEWYFVHVRKLVRLMGTFGVTTAAELKPAAEDATPLADYLFRFNRGAFWMGAYFMERLPFGYSELNRNFFSVLFQTKWLYKLIHWLGEEYIAQWFIVQDLYIPSRNVSNFVKETMDEHDIFPLWLCPVKATRDPQELAPHAGNIYKNDENEMAVNVGLYGTTRNTNYVEANVNLEKTVFKYKGRKMLYAHSYYTEPEFWRIYDETWYKSIREKYHAQDSFVSVYRKVCSRSHTRKK